jgi:hypothetical protein
MGYKILNLSRPNCSGKLITNQLFIIYFLIYRDINHDGYFRKWYNNLIFKKGYRIKCY